MMGEKGERQVRSGNHGVTFDPTNGRGHSSAVQSFGNEFWQHRKELEQEIHRIAKELKEMQVEVAGEDNIAQLRKRSRTLPAHRIRTIAANEERIQFKTHRESIQQ